MDTGVTTNTVARWGRVSFPSLDAWCAVCGRPHKHGGMRRNNHSGALTCERCAQRIDDWEARVRFARPVVANP